MSRDPERKVSHKIAGQVVVGIIFIIVLASFALFFLQIPTDDNTLAMDWRTVWSAIRGGDLQYLPVDGIRFPPWSLVPLLPLGFLPMQAGWGILAGFGVAILLASIPRVGTTIEYGFSALLLVLSFPAIRNIADGNMENLVVGGVLLILYGYSTRRIPAMVAGLLFATVKIQEVTLLLIMVAAFIIHEWPRRDWLRAGVATASIVSIALLWRGSSWFVSLFGENYLKYTHSIIDISVSATLNRLDFIPPYMIVLIIVVITGVSLLIAWRNMPILSHELAAMLLAGSLLIAPYASGNSVLCVVAIGLIPLFQANRILGGFLLALINLPYLWSADTLFNYQAYYWTSITFLCWLVLARRCLTITTKTG